MEPKEKKKDIDLIGWSLLSHLPVLLQKTFPLKVQIALTAAEVRSVESDALRHDDVHLITHSVEEGKKEKKKGKKTKVDAIIRSIRSWKIRGKRKQQNESSRMGGLTVSCKIHTQVRNHGPGRLLDFLHPWHPGGRLLDASLDPRAQGFGLLEVSLSSCFSSSPCPSFPSSLPCPCFSSSSVENHRNIVERGWMEGQNIANNENEFQGNDIFVGKKKE